MASAVGWRQRGGFRRIAGLDPRTRYQPVLDDGRGLYRVRTRSGLVFRPLWRRRLEIVDVTEEAEPITFRSRSRALSIAVATEELALAKRAEIEVVE